MKHIQILSFGIMKTNRSACWLYCVYSAIVQWIFIECSKVGSYAYAIGGVWSINFSSVKIGNLDLINHSCSFACAWI